MLFIIFSNAVFSTVLYALGQETSFASHLLLGISLYVYFSKFQRKTSYFRINSISIAVGYTLISISALVASLFDDFSWDGRQYQSEAVLQIHLGLNPVREVIIPGKWDVSWALWINSLSKVQWILREIPLDFGLNMNSINYLNYISIILLALAGFALGGSLCLTRRQALFIGLVAVSSIPVILQISTGYADALPVTLLTIFCIVSTVLIKGEIADGYDKILVLLAILLVTTKLSQVISFAVVVSLLSLVSFKFRRVFLNVKSIILISITVALLSFNPLITNAFLYGNPFYPFKSSPIFSNSPYSVPNLIGAEGSGTFQDLVYSANIPMAFQSSPSFLTNLLSPFLTTTNDVAIADLSELFKLPFVIKTSELMSLHQPDLRIGGLGPFFLTIFLTLLLGMGLGRKHRVFILVSFAVAIGIVLTPYGWWSRYTGFSWAIVPIGLALTYSEIDKFSVSRKKLVKGLFALIGVLAIGQAILAASLTLGNSIQNTRYLNLVYENNATPVELDSAFSGYRYNYILSGRGYVLKVVEVDYFNNMISPNLSESERLSYLACYASREEFLQFHNGLKSLNSSSKLFNQNGVLKLVPESCDLSKLATLEEKRTLLGFPKQDIFQSQNRKT